MEKKQKSVKIRGIERRQLVDENLTYLPVDAGSTLSMVILPARENIILSAVVDNPDKIRKLIIEIDKDGKLVGQAAVKVLSESLDAEEDLIAFIKGLPDDHRIIFNHWWKSIEPILRKRFWKAGKKVRIRRDI